MLSCDLSLITMHISDCCQFSNIHISQGSVATYLRCSGIFKYEFVANLPVSLPVKEFWKSVNIWGSYGQEFSVLFFLRHSVYSNQIAGCVMVCLYAWKITFELNHDSDDIHDGPKNSDCCWQLITSQQSEVGLGRRMTSKVSKICLEKACIL